METLSQKIEKAIRRYNWIQALKKCVKISKKETKASLERVDKAILHLPEYREEKYHELLCMIRAKIVYPEIQKVEI